MALTGLTKIKGSTSKIAATGTDKERKLADRFGYQKTVLDEGATPDGSDSTQAILDFQNNNDYIIVSGGKFTVGTLEINKPIYFINGGSIDVSDGNTCTIRSAIFADEVQIFHQTGTGDYVLGNDTSSGENARYVKASWFGIFPTPLFVKDQGPDIHRLFSYLGNTRESVVNFQMGNYHLVTGVGVTRGGWVRGCGQRRTVFKAYADNFDMFYTENIACRFTDIQQELDLSTITDRTNGAFIRILHDHCDIDNVSVSTGREIIVVEDNDCRISNILCTFNGNSTAGSALVSINAGSNCYINGIEMSGTTGPESIVNVGYNASGTISGANINNIRHSSNSRSVTVSARGGNVTRTVINNVSDNSFTGTKHDSVIHISAEGSNNLDYVTIDGVMSSSVPVNGIIIEQNSSGNLRHIMLDQVMLPALTGTGLSLTRNNGSLTNINSDVCHYADCATPVSQTGSMDEIRFNPMYQLEPAQPSFAYEVNIDDDTVKEINLNRSVFSGLVTIVAGSARYGLFSVRAASSPSVVTINAASNVVATNTALNGTTGTDGNITLGVTNGVLYIENRSGGAQPISVGMITGQSE